MSESIKKLMAAVSGFQSASILMAACELDLFTRILRMGRPVTPEELAQEVSCDPRGLRTLVGALTALRYLTESEGKFAVPAQWSEALDLDHPASMIPMIRHCSACQRSWSQLAFTVKTGCPFPKQASLLGPLADYQSFILGMDSIARGVVGPLTEKMKGAGLLDFRNMLDLGGASGTYTLAFLAANPNGIGTIFDLPIAIREARQKTEDSPMADRVSLCAGDYDRDELPGGFDFVWISAIIHSMNDAKTGDLFAKTFRALTPGGRVAVRDVYFHPNRTGPEAAAFFAVNMLVNTESGKVYTREEVFALLTRAGFQNPRMAIPADDMSAVIVAEKP